MGGDNIARQGGGAIACDGSVRIGKHIYIEETRLHGMRGAWDGKQGDMDPSDGPPRAGTRGWWGVGFEGEGLCTKIAGIEQKMA